MLKVNFSRNDAHIVVGVLFGGYDETVELVEMVGLVIHGDASITRAGNSRMAYRLRTRLASWHGRRSAMGTDRCRTSSGSAIYSGRVYGRSLASMGGDTMRQPVYVQSNGCATWLLITLAAIAVLAISSMALGIDLAALVGLARDTTTSPVFGGIVPTRAPTVYTVSTAVPPAPPQAQPAQVAPRVEYIMVTVPAAVQPAEQLATPEPVIMVVTVAPAPTVAPLPTATLPVLPEYGPYTKEQYDLCHAIVDAGRLQELPRPQMDICTMYTRP